MMAGRLSADDLLELLKGHTVGVELNKATINLIGDDDTGALSTETPPYYHIGVLVGWSDDFLFINLDENKELSVDTMLINLKCVLSVAKVEAEYTELLPESVGGTLN